MDQLTYKKKLKVYRARCCACGTVNQRLLLEDSHGLFECEKCGAINAEKKKYWDMSDSLVLTEPFMTSNSVILSRLIAKEELRQIG